MDEIQDENEDINVTPNKPDVEVLEKPVETAENQQIEKVKYDTQGFIKPIGMN